MDRLRLESLLWGKSLPIRRWLRSMRGRLADLKHLLATWAGRRPQTRIRAVAAGSDPSSVPDRRHRWTMDTPRGGGVEALPEEVEEALRLVAAAEDLEVAILVKPAKSACTDTPGEAVRVKWLSLPATPSSHRPLNQSRPDLKLSAKTLQIPGGHQAAASPDHPFASVDGYWLPPGYDHGRRLVHRVHDAYCVLRDLPELKGPPTLLFLLPFLAVGGAERLLFDLLAELTTRYRCLVVTLEPHRSQLGFTLDRCAEHTPHIFPLGDWLPREAHFGALSHLIRRFGVRSLISWNGTVFFFDRVAELRRRFPSLRILSQLYHFEGGWTARTSPEVIRAVDIHLAVNGPIQDSLIERLQISADRVELIHHGVAVPKQVRKPGEPSELGQGLRQRLGIPQDAVVIGSFIRLHPQKRPLDILKLAERLSANSSLPERPWFLLMGGGPMDDEVDRRLASRPIPGLTRLSMQTDPLPYYEALDLCLMTSDYEGLPVFLLDGMARGLPAIAPTVGDIPFLLKEGGGLTSGLPGDLDALEQAIRRLLDPKTRAESARIARKTIEERFNLQTYCAAYERAILGPDPGDSASA